MFRISKIQLNYVAVYWFEIQGMLRTCKDKGYVAFTEIKFVI